MKQIKIQRVLIRDPKILILDEATSSVELIQWGGVYHDLFQKQFAGIQAGNSAIGITEIT